MTVSGDITPAFFIRSFCASEANNPINTSLDVAIPMLRLDDNMHRIGHSRAFVVTFSYTVVIKNPENP